MFEPLDGRASLEAKKSTKVSQIKDSFVRVGLRKDRAAQLQHILLFPIIDSEGNYVAIVRLPSREGHPQLIQAINETFGIMTHDAVVSNWNFRK